MTNETNMLYRKNDKKGSVLVLILVFMSFFAVLASV